MSDGPDRDGDDAQPANGPDAAGRSESGASDDGTPAPRTSAGRTSDKKFHPWRLLGVIGLVIVALAGISALIDVLVLGW